MKARLVFLTAFVSLCLASNVSAQNFCGTSSNFANTLANYSALSKGAQTNSVIDNCTNITVKLQFHIIRNSNGSGGQPNSIVN